MHNNQFMHMEKADTERIVLYIVVAFYEKTVGVHRSSMCTATLVKIKPQINIFVVLFISFISFITNF